MFNETIKILQKIKQKNPLILNITNDVTMDFIANGLLSLGASPIMSKAPQEIEDLLKITQAVVINLGTLTSDFIALCKHTCQLANELKKPIILDPVGAGATHFRTAMSQELFHQFAIAIVRANASEIIALSGTPTTSKGVDSLAQSHDAIENAKQLSQKYNSAIVISGKIDRIIDQEQFFDCDRGSAIMPLITGTGCLLSAVVAAFHAVENNRYEAAKQATLFYALCGEIAEKKSTSPGSFKVEFLNTLHNWHGTNTFS